MIRAARHSVSVLTDEAVASVLQSATATRAKIFAQDAFFQLRLCVDTTKEVNLAPSSAGTFGGLTHQHRQHRLHCETVACVAARRRLWGQPRIIAAVGNQFGIRLGSYLSADVDSTPTKQMSWTPRCLEVQ